MPLELRTPEHPIALAGISAALVLAPAANPAIADVKLTLEGLDLDGTGAHDVALDPQKLEGEATQLLLGLLREKLHEIGSGAGGEAAALATHLMPLLGFEDSLPAFPFAALTSDPTAIAKWLRSLLAGSPAPIETWLEHLAGVLGVTAPAVRQTTSGASTTWSVAIFTPESSSIGLELAHTNAADGVTPQLELGLTLSLVPAGASPPARFDASVTVCTLPLAGSAAPVAFPNASLSVVAPGDSSKELIAPGGAFAVDSLTAGLRWSAGSLEPQLEMNNVVVDGVSYPVIDLGNANTVISDALGAALTGALGNAGAGAQLATLAGLIAPATDPGAPTVDLKQLAANPTRAFATVHRNALLSSTHPWSNYFSELTALLGLPGQLSGSGSSSAPWTATIASSGALTLSLAAWNAQSSANPAEAQQLRIGLLLATGSGPVEASLSAELFGVDLQASGPSKVAILSGYRAAVRLLPSAPAELSGITLSAASIDATFELTVGDPPVVGASIEQLSLTVAGATTTVAKLPFPLPSSFDPTNPASTLGVAADDLEALVLGLLRHTLGDQLGPAGLALAALMGCAAGLPGVPADFPALANPRRPWIDIHRPARHAAHVADERRHRRRRRRQ